MILHPRDAAIFALARRLLGDTTNFGEALRALQAAVEQLIPSGRIYLLGATSVGPIVGSLISRIGITPSATDAIQIVRA